MSADRPSYRWAALTHGLNLAAVAALALAGAWDHRVWALVVPFEAAVAWVVPDLPPFRQRVDLRHLARQRLEERTRYLDQLWGVASVDDAPGLRGWLVEGPAADPDDRVVERGSAEFAAYLEMRSIVAGLRDLVGVRGVHVTLHEVARCEDVVVGYLRLLVACRPLERAVAGVDRVGLDREIAALDDRLSESIEAPLRTALAERRQLLVHQRSRAPRLEATLQLFRARADAIVQQLRNLHGQVLADPGMNVNEMLDQVFDQQEALTDPLAQATADQLVDEFVRRPAVQRRLGQPG